jgi:hypothetical protein
MGKNFALAEVKILDSDDPNGSFEVILSAPTLDRDGEVIDARAFEPLPPHITFDIDHGLSTATTVGSGAPYYDGDLLKVRGTFSSIARAQEVRTLVAEGHIRTTSVAFMEPKREVKDGVPHIVKAELLNGAFVPVPANREAVVVAAKSAQAHAEARFFAAAAGVELEPALAKTIAGSYEARRQQLRDALHVAHPDSWWVTILATFDDAVVYELDTRDGLEQYQASYSFADDGTVTLGSAEPVTVSEVVTAQKSRTADPEEKAGSAAADEAAADPADPPAEAGSTIALARARAASAEAEALA